eukprot:8355870-Pyramimonas_sp.AAC.1
MAVFACVSPTEGPSGGVRMRSPSPRTALRGPLGSSTEAPSGGVGMRLARPTQRLRPPYEGSTEGHSGGFRMSPPPNTAPRGHIGSPTEEPSGGVRARLPHSIQRSVALSGAPPKAPVAVCACVSPTQHNDSWPPTERAPPKAPMTVFEPPPSTAPCGPIGSPTGGPSGCVRARLSHS